MTSQNFLIEGSCEFMVGSSLFYGTTLISFVTIDIVMVDICFCHIGSCGHMLKGLCEFIYEWKPFTVSHHLPMFGGHWSSGTGDIKYWICHITLQNHVIEGSCNFMIRSSSWHITTLPTLVTIDIVVVEIKCFSFVTWSCKTTRLKSHVT